MSAASTRIHHIQLAMPAGGEAAAEEFYGRVLGLTMLAKPSHLQSRGGRWFACGPIQVHLGVEEPFSPARKAHPAFVVDDLPAIRSALALGGHDIVDDTQIQGFDRFYTADPFGNRVEILAHAVDVTPPRRA